MLKRGSISGTITEMHVAVSSNKVEESEQIRYEALHSQAKPLITQAKDFFEEHKEKGNNGPDAKVSVASWLKKFGKRYGYAYRGYANYIYSLEKSSQTDTTSVLTLCPAHRVRMPIPM